MQEMRITPELPTYNEILHQIFLEFIDGKLTTPERSRHSLSHFAARSAAAGHHQALAGQAGRGRRSKNAPSTTTRMKSRLPEDDDLDDIGGDDEEIDLGFPKGDARR